MAIILLYVNPLYSGNLLGFQAGPFFPTFPYFFWFAPTFPYFIVKMPYYPYFFTLKCHLHVKLQDFFLARITRSDF